MMKKIKELIKELNKATEAYDNGKPYMSDKDWDSLYFQLVQMEKENGIYLSNSPTQNINYKIVNELKKVKHTSLMLSLDKTKDWNSFKNYFKKDKDVIIMLKEDGLTCRLTYAGGRLVGAETRGNGEIGEDILHSARVIKTIPRRIKYTGDLIIDGEVICTYKDFEEFKGEYKNPRNFASGSIRLLDANEVSKRKLSFIAWNIVEGLDGNSLYKKLNKLEEFGFSVVPRLFNFEEDTQDFLKKEAEYWGHPIDGLVARYDDIAFSETLGSTAHHRNDSYAFKFYDESYDTTLIDIEYEPSRNGQLTPVAIVAPIEIDGSTVSRCTLHNISIMKELNGGNAHKGDTLSIYKANSIIPECSKWSHTGDEYISIPEICPVCGGNTEIRTSDSGVKTLWCTKPSCEGKLINKLEHMYGKGKIEIKGLSKATFEKLIELGWINKPRDIFETLNQKQELWKRIAGFGVASVEKILKAIEEGKKCKLEQVICAAGIPLIGARASKSLAKEFKTWNDFRNATKEEYKFYNLEGFGIEMHNAIVNFDYSEIDYIAENYLTIENEDAEVASNGSLNGITFCITGKVSAWKNRNELKSYIESLGGKVVGSMSSKVNYLINNDSTSTTAKNKTAQSLGIPIITEEQFKKLV